MRRLPLILLFAAVGCDGSAPLDAPIDATSSLDVRELDVPARDSPAVPDAPGDAGPPARCSGAAAPTLGGVSLAPVSGLPIRDGFAPGWGIVEGPVWIGDGLLVSHFGGGPTPASRLYRVTPGGAVSVAIDDAGTNGLALGPDGRLYAAHHGLGAIVAFDLDDLGAAPSTLVGTFGGERFNGPNDLTVRSDGAVYFTDPDYQAPSPRPQAATRVYLARPGGEAMVIADDLGQPNGIALSLDERTLFVGHAGGLVRYPLAADGSVAGPRVNVPAITGGVDGLGRDCAGDLYVTTGGAVVVLDPSGTELGRLSAPGATNVAFGGADGRTLYVTSLGDPPALRAATLDVTGLPD